MIYFLLLFSKIGWSAQWCESKEKSILKTIQAIKAQTNKKSCTKALRSLSFQDSLDLSNMGISDLRPLKNQKQLRVLLLRNNVIEDITSLSNLKKLQWLDISENPIADIRTKYKHGEVGIPGLFFYIEDGYH